MNFNGIGNIFGEPQNNGGDPTPSWKYLVIVLGAFIPKLELVSIALLWYWKVPQNITWRIVATLFLVGSFVISLKYSALLL